MCGACRHGCGQRASVSRVSPDGLKHGSGQEPQPAAQTPIRAIQKQLLLQIRIVTQQLLLLVQQRLQPLTKAALEQLG